jgi:hypothetical protein
MIPSGPTIDHRRWSMVYASRGPRLIHGPRLGDAAIYVVLPRLLGVGPLPGLGRAPRRAVREPSFLRKGTDLTTSGEPAMLTTEVGDPLANSAICAMSVNASHSSPLAMEIYSLSTV